MYISPLQNFSEFQKCGVVTVTPDHERYQSIRSKTLAHAGTQTHVQITYGIYLNTLDKTGNVRDDKPTTTQREGHPLNKMVPIEKIYRDTALENEPFHTAPPSGHMGIYFHRKWMEAVTGSNQIYR